MTAKVYAELATQATELATRIQQSGSACEPTENLVIYHLRTAASKLRELAEFVAEQERVRGTD